MSCEGYKVWQCDKSKPISTLRLETYLKPGTKYCGSYHFLKREFATVWGKCDFTTRSESELSSPKQDHRNGLATHVVKE